MTSFPLAVAMPPAELPMPSKSEMLTAMTLSPNPANPLPLRINLKEPDNNSRIHLGMEAVAAGDNAGGGSKGTDK